MRDSFKTGQQSKPAALGKQIRSMNLLENIFIVVLAFYPLRHISWGLDLWDTGYNYANFQYMGMEHMDPMWLFSTYLSNAVGNLLTKLPNGHTLLGMNFYTGLFASALALLGYFFCTRSLKMPKWIAFLGEMLALSLCWCPTALLYNYMTYVLFLLMCIFLYLGLVKDKGGLLFTAGIFLGLNVLVRFSNLPEAAMIVAVWAYSIILWLEERKNGEKGKFWPRICRHTGFCLGGFLAALAVMFLYIQVRYGMDEYIAGIMRLFGMTDTATDYKPTSMITGMIDSYVENLYWVIRIGVISFGGVASFLVSRFVQQFSGRIRVLWSSAVGLVAVAFYGYMFANGKLSFIGGQFFLQVEGLIFLLVLLIAALGCWWEKVPKYVWVVVLVAMPAWLYANHFASMHFYSYDSMLRAGVLFLMLTMLIGAIRIFHPGSSREEKLISGMVILIILLTSLGSNNKVYPSLNNLFLAAPYTLWQCCRFVCHVKKTVISRELTHGKINHKLTFAIEAFPLKCILVSFLAVCFFQFGMFGAKFVFAESTGVQDISGVVENNEVLRGIKMPAEKAQWMTEISAYVNENGLQGREVILYGYVPALSYYLQMPSAFNPWSDLLSYSVETMKQDLAELEARISEKGEEKPVIILEDKYAEYLEKPETSLNEWEDDFKWRMIVVFMEKLGYQQTFRNEKFAIYESAFNISSLWDELEKVKAK